VDAAADTIHEIRSLVTELVRAEHVVATVTEVLTGNTVNVIPTRGRLRGTIRSLSTGQRKSLIAGIEAIVHRTAERVGVTSTFSLTDGYPAVVNDPGFVGQMLECLSVQGLADRVREMPKPSMVIEDFAYFLQRWPGAMVYLGANVEGHSSFNHSADVVFDESAMVTGAALHMMAADGFSQNQGTARAG
jgi:hippurate hydrolase